MKKRNAKNGFTLTELLVAVGLLASILTASTIIFRYSIDAQRSAMATAEVMRSLRAVTDQLNLQLEGLQKNGYLIIWSNKIGSNPAYRDGLYFFSAGDFQSAYKDTIRSNIARIYFGPSGGNDPNNLLLDARLLTPGTKGEDYNDVSFTDCQTNISTLEGDPNNIVIPNKKRPAFDLNRGNLLAQRVSDMRIDWTYDSDEWNDSANKNPKHIEWYGSDKPRNDPTYEINTGNPYHARWSPYNQSKWPAALKFRFTIYDSKGILKGGRTFEHIVYIGQ